MGGEEQWEFKSRCSSLGKLYGAAELTNMSNSSPLLLDLYKSKAHRVYSNHV